MKQKFTLMIRGHVLADSEEALLAAIARALQTHTDFKLAYKSVEVWMDGNGTPRKFNDDGTDYVEPPKVDTENK